jgi:hypothetical protein
VFALIPDKFWGVTYAAELSSEDCPLARQGQWLGSQYETISTQDMAEFPNIVQLLDAARRPSPPNLDWHCSNYNCICTPVFMECFPGQFDPIFSGVGLWSPVEPEQP